MDYKDEELGTFNYEARNVVPFLLKQQLSGFN
jgi:hypothetical protein